MNRQTTELVSALGTVAKHVPIVMNGLLLPPATAGRHALRQEGSTPLGHESGHVAHPNT
ncbi:hypothetical protein [Amycolatopsis sp. H20-H5]|uniref:hypothetical protein n=1 Tax=Amycolatopsis sp. H20-H5 TaxID=3046309 RepID=UPI002DB79511|nr:hypothetical protein [Amycolatopsis sp. H20-H5]MEC3978158.1 hypothetical protein [Amycolatopsis sp. H20-H5]